MNFFPAEIVLEYELKVERIEQLVSSPASYALKKFRFLWHDP